MSAATATAAAHDHELGQPMRPRNAVLGALLGYIGFSLVLYWFREWAGGVTFDADSFPTWRTMLGFGAPSDYTLVGACGAVLGFAGGLVGFHVFRGPGFWRAMWGAALGYAVGAAGTMVIRQLLGWDAYEGGPVYVFGVVSSLMFYIWGIGGWGYWWDYMRGEPTPEHEDHSGHGARSWKSYFTFNTDHKVIGVQYVVTTFFFMLMAGALAQGFRVELARPGLQMFESGTAFNQSVSVHGIVMLLAFIIPVFAGLANFVLPIMIGAPDMAFPRLNALSYWMLLFGGAVFLAAIPIGAFEAGWTNYAPLSSAMGAGEVTIGQLAFVMGVQIAGTSSILTAINFIVTIITMRAPGMTLWRMPLLVWANFTTSMLVVFGTPFIAGSQFMVLFDAILGTRFFNAVYGGDAIAYQHIFWFYSHPAVYIMILPGFGIISEVITSHSRKPLFGYKALALSTLGIGVLGFTVWAHHMFTSGMAEILRPIMMFTTMLIAVPTGIKVLGWAATLWRGAIQSTVPMMFTLGFLFTFTIGGLTGIMLASVPFDIHVQDTYFVVAHFHYVLFGGSVMTVFAGVYHWFPKMTGRMYDHGLGKMHFWLTFIGMNLTFFPMHWVGTLGMPRRVADYQNLALLHPEVEGWNFLITVGALIQGVAFAVFVYNMVASWRSGPIAPANPWRAHTLEWLVSSPPPLFNFYDTPRVIAGPYTFGVPDARHAIVAEKGQVLTDADVTAAIAASPNGAHGGGH